MPVCPISKHTHIMGCLSLHALPSQQLLPVVLHLLAASLCGGVASNAVCSFVLHNMIPS